MNPIILTPLLCIDPSSTFIGWALLGPGPTHIASGSYHTAGMNNHDRVVSAGEVALDIVNECTARNCKPAAILIEVPDYVADRYNPGNLLSYVRAAGAAEFALSRVGLPLFRETSSKTNRGSSKSQRMERFRMLVNRNPRTDDESDALCMGWDFLLSHQQPSPCPSL